jgi:hypothetical protein
MSFRDRGLGTRGGADDDVTAVPVRVRDLLLAARP